MIYYANPAGDDVRDEMARGRLGCITTPEQGNTVFPDEWDVIADNGCFSGRWEHGAWLRWLLDQPRTIAHAPIASDPEPPEHTTSTCRESPSTSVRNRSNTCRRAAGSDVDTSTVTHKPVSFTTRYDTIVGAAVLSDTPEHPATLANSASESRL